ncbi:MAG: c-type cytochrome [Candidatus Obscuribacterales bacterium]
MILRFTCCLFLTALTTLIIVSTVSAEDGANIFTAKCAGCHTVGKGQLVGPDLLNSKDKDAAEVKASVTRMQTQAGPLTSQEIDALVQFIKSGGEADAEKPAAPETSRNANKPASTTPGTASGTTTATATENGDAEEGKRIFMGAQSLKNGGMACAACHAVEGVGNKNLGPDLSAIGGKMNEQALLMACEKTPYKVMKNAYKNCPVTHEEALDLTAFLLMQKGQISSTSALNVEIAGAAAAAVLVGAIAFGYRHRKGSARDKLQRR